MLCRLALALVLFASPAIAGERVLVKMKAADENPSNCGKGGSFRLTFEGNSFSFPTFSAYRETIAIGHDGSFSKQIKFMNGGYTLFGNVKSRILNTTYSYGLCRFNSISWEVQS